MKMHVCIHYKTRVYIRLKVLEKKRIFSFNPKKIILTNVRE